MIGRYLNKGFLTVRKFDRGDLTWSINVRDFDLNYFYDRNFCYYIGNSANLLYLFKTHIGSGTVPQSWLNLLKHCQNKMEIKVSTAVSYSVVELLLIYSFSGGGSWAVNVI